MKHDKTQKLVWAGLFTALVTVATMVIRVPSPQGGYFNVGDAIVILSAFLLGPAWGAFAAGLGSALADIFTPGGAIYAPATFIIKALMALSAAFILRFAQNKKSLPAAIFGSIFAEIIMVGGYYVFEAAILGIGWIVALGNVPANCFQGIVGATAGTALFFALLRIPYVKNTF